MQDGPFRATVLEPVGRLNQYFNNVNAAIDKRNHKLIDYDSTRAKVRKLVEKPADDSTKLPRVSHANPSLVLTSLGAAGTRRGARNLRAAQ